MQVHSARARDTGKIDWCHLSPAKRRRLEDGEVRWTSKVLVRSRGGETSGSTRHRALLADTLRAYVIGHVTAVLGHWNLSGYVTVTVLTGGSKGRKNVRSKFASGIAWPEHVLLHPSIWLSVGTKLQDVHLAQGAPGPETAPTQGDLNRWEDLLDGLIVILRKRQELGEYR